MLQLQAPGRAVRAMAEWAKQLAGIKGVVLDISGVLYDGGGEGGGVPIPGSIEAVEKIKASGLKLRFCTNETQATRGKFVAKLQRLGFNILVNEVTAPAPAACRILKERNLRPHLLVHDDLVPEFDQLDKANPNCVVIGDAADNFSYKNLNEAFRVLIGLENPILISLGRGMLVMFKPRWWESRQKCFFNQPWQKWKLSHSRPCDEQHPEVKADGYVNNLAEAVDIIVKRLHK
ncbi:phospholysine phosphohistidine inorganic pyrophosphate phosphatase isoform X3 [Gopherus flavomarginatus]|uniref:phospholysine phosphohistidine inorganic pyrophosphate phosphatase isoform X3 n=1 Tax=Gopherus flavomarginatus TaxID=286002 RepID=UPI0021CBCBA5|nr:phospholysine phosphohistidine inorganic pyrophosphate phosphatase isoform X3 [Gopherus flavomarginatus]